MEFYFSEVDKDVLILRADGGLNSDTTEEFVADLEKMIDVGLERIVVDCAHLEAISSIGLAALIRLHKRLKRRGGDVRLASVKGLVARVLEITHLDHLFAIYPDLARAMLSFRPIGAALAAV